MKPTAPEMLGTIVKYPDYIKIKTYLQSIGYVVGTKKYYEAFNTELKFRRRFGGCNV